MSLEIVDELMTPGCPQCAVKHLSAALYHRAKVLAPVMLAPDPYMTCVCTAYINLVEVKAGYRSHLWYAVGALVRAEEHAAPGAGGYACVAREARLMLEERGLDALLDAVNCISEGTAPTHADWAVAHFDEAMRELPAFANEMRMDDLIGSIERIRKEYFDLPEATVAEGETTTKEGEPEMATNKKAACKGGSCSPKGKCAEKGGTTAKAAKACAKGGKCKK